MTGNLKSSIEYLYRGTGSAAKLFRGALVVFDIVTIGYFLATAIKELTPLLLAIDVTLGSVFAIEFAMRLWIARDRRRYLLSWNSLTEIVVILTLFAAVFVQNLAFLRILRTLRFLQSIRVANDLKSVWPKFAEIEHVVDAAANLLVFIFIVTSLVWVLEAKTNPHITEYVDALYFTITTLTTTGFGDIVLEDQPGRWLTIAIMVVGVALFLRLVQQVFRPRKIHYVCEHCGLSLHDPDASHCKHCGNVIFIQTEGT